MLNKVTSVRVAITPPDVKGKNITKGITAKDEVLSGIQDAQAKISAEHPDRIITIGGNGMLNLLKDMRILTEAVSM